MKKIIEDWCYLAGKDVRAATELIDDEYYTTIVAFHCQQAIEKYLKAFLLENGQPLQKIHDLVKLYNDVKQLKDFGFDEDKIVFVNKVYIDTRYPGGLGLLPDGEPNQTQARQFLDFAREVRRAVLAELRR